MKSVRNLTRPYLSMFHVRPTRLDVINSLYDRIIRYVKILVYRRGQLFRSNGHAVTVTRSQTRLTVTDRRLAVTDTQ